jgi:general stress protein YciG
MRGAVPASWRRKEALTGKEGAVEGMRKERRGFASMSPEKQREIASKGGRAAHEKGTAHEWTADEARAAGRKGGQISRGGRGRLVVPTDSPVPGAGEPTGPR